MTFQKCIPVRSVNRLLPDESVHRRKRSTLVFEHWLRDELRPDGEKEIKLGWPRRREFSIVTRWPISGRNSCKPQRSEKVRTATST